MDGGTVCATSRAKTTGVVRPRGKSRAMATTTTAQQRSRGRKPLPREGHDNGVAHCPLCGKDREVLERNDSLTDPSQNDIEARCCRRRRIPLPQDHEWEGPQKRRPSAERDETRHRKRCEIPPTPAFAQKVTRAFGYAQSVRHGDTVYVSGTIGVDGTGKLVKGDMRAQAERVFDNLEETLKLAGCRGLEDVVRLESVLVDAKRNGRAFGEVRRRRMPPNAFASMAYGVPGLLVEGALVEVQCTAVVNR